MTKQKILLHVNRATQELEAAPNRLLLEALREDLGLTGTKCGCDDSSCGACTVLVNGRPAMSCLMLAASYQDAEITTIEGLAPGKTRLSELASLQRAFAECGGVQCGFCTPGLILTTCSLLEKTPHPTDAEINEALSGNLCRCTGYTQILESVRRAIELMEKESAGEVVRP